MRCGNCVQIDYAKVIFVLTLTFYPVANGTEIIAEVQIACWLNSWKNALFAHKERRELRSHFYIDTLSRSKMLFVEIHKNIGEDDSAVETASTQTKTWLYPAVETASTQTKSAFADWRINGVFKVDCFLELGLNLRLKNLAVNCQLSTVFRFSTQPSDAGCEKGDRKTQGKRK